MIKIYYLDRAIIFGSRAELNDSDVCFVESIDQTKLDFFSESAKPLAIICEDTLLEFQKFCATFEVIEAAGGVVRNPSGETLMIFRNGRWDLPKGKSEKGETIEQCALREVEEECGITNLTLGDFVAHTYHIYKLRGKYVLKRSWWWMMSYHGSDVPTPQTEEGITKVSWVSRSHMNACVENTYPTIRELIHEIENLR